MAEPLVESVDGPDGHVTPELKHKILKDETQSSKTLEQHSVSQGTSGPKDIYGMRQTSQKYRAALLVGVSPTINQGLSDKDRAYVEHLLNAAQPPSKTAKPGPYEHVKSRLFDAPVGHNDAYME